ncbi:MAG: mannose-1-phosphate guanylyltransferase [Anaerolineales bacterium]
MTQHEHLYPLIMAGGGGTRLWPLSRQAHPKQALKLFGDRTMFQLAVDRLTPLLPPEQIFVVTTADQVADLAAQAPELPEENFIVEPMGRGTAPCIGLSALHLRERDPDAVMVVLTADHFIGRREKFRQVLAAAQEAARQDYLVTLGIEPAFASTGYGYIRQGERLGEIGGFDYFAVEQFTEKPDAERAEKFVASGDYAWNSGMFIWRVERILAAMERWMPKFYETLMTLDDVLGAPDYEEVLQTRWPQVKKETIDYGIMEKAEKVAVFPVDLEWSDVGTWDAVMALREADDAGNIFQGDVIGVDAERTMVFSDYDRQDRLVALIGVEDLIVVDTPDALLITRRDRAQDVRDVVQQLRDEGCEDKL